MDPASAHLDLLDDPIQPSGWMWDSGHAAMDPSPPWIWDPRNEPPLTVVPPPPQSPEPVNPPHQEPTVQDPRLVKISTAFARIIAEALDGRRRMSQLESHFMPEALLVLVRCQRRMLGTHMRVASVRVQPGSPDDAELTLRLVTDDAHNHAAALRISTRNGQWVCTDLVMG